MSPLVRVDSTRQLFVDDFLIDRADGVRRRWHPLNKPSSTPVLWPLTPWERTSVHLGGTVVRDARDGLFKMWYFAGHGGRAPVICYATSLDGIHWERPVLGLYPFRDEWQNNIVVPASTPEGVPYRLGAFNPVLAESDAGLPYQSLSFSFPGHGGSLASKFARDIPHPAGVYLFTSPDGLHWHERPAPLFLFADGFGDAPRLMYDRYRNRYVGFLKGYEDEQGRRLDRRMVGDALKPFAQTDDTTWVELAEHAPVIRRRALTVSEDLTHWTPPRLILPADDADERGTQMYTNTGFCYEGMYLGFLTLYHTRTTERARAGTLPVQVITSRDGEGWQRPAERVTMLAPGKVDRDWDYGSQLLMNTAPVRVGDELWVYYSSQKMLHSPDSRGDPLMCSIGRATLRLDGFASIGADSDPGTLRTKQMRLTGDRIVLNVDASDGEVALQVLDDGGRPSPGRSLLECVPIRVDKTSVEVRWQSADLPTLGDSVVQLEFHLRKAELYSFWTEP